MYDQIRISFQINTDDDDTTHEEIRLLKDNTIYKIKKICDKYRCVHTGSSRIDKYSASMCLTIPKHKTSNFIKHFKKPLRIRTTRSYYESITNCCFLSSQKRRWMTDIKYHYVWVIVDYYD